MADNSIRTPGAGESIASDELTYSGDTAKVQLVRVVHVAGTEGSKTLTEVVDATDGMLVNLGSNNDVTGTVTANLGTIAGVATEATLSTLDGKVTACNTGAVVIASGTTVVTSPTAANLKAEVVGTGTFATQSTLAAETTKVIGTVNIAAAQTITATGPLTDAELRATPVPVSGTVSVTGVATAANQLADGHNVTIDNAAGASAVNIQDGGNTISVDGTITANLAAGTNNIGDVDVLTINGVAPAFGTGARGATVQRVTIATDDIVPASQSGTWTVQPGNTANTTPWLISEATRTSGGPTTYHLVSAGTTNATNIKASAGQLYGWYIYNSNAAARKVAFHNTAGTPTAGASVYFSLVIPAMSGANVFLPHGIPFATGIAITTVTGLADTDATAVALNDLIINLWYA